MGIPWGSCRSADSELSLNSKPALPGFALLGLDSENIFVLDQLALCCTFPVRGAEGRLQSWRREKAPVCLLLLGASTRHCFFSPTATVPFCCSYFQFVDFSTFWINFIVRLGDPPHWPSNSPVMDSSLFFYSPNSTSGNYFLQLLSP